jgi:hypothetical protein
MPPGMCSCLLNLVHSTSLHCTAPQLLWKYNKEATLMRLAFLANQPRGGPSHTVGTCQLGITGSALQELGEYYKRLGLTTS